MSENKIFEDEHGPIEEKHAGAMKQLGRVIDDWLNQGKGKKVGFVLLMFDFGEKPNGRMNYLSNAERESMLRALQELVGQMEREGKTRQ